MPQNQWAPFHGWQCWLGLREYTDEHFNQKQGDNRWVAGPWENHQVFKLTSTHNRTQISFQRENEFWQYNTMTTVVDLPPKETFQSISMKFIEYSLFLVYSIFNLRGTMACYGYVLFCWNFVTPAESRKLESKIKQKLISDHRGWVKIMLSRRV